MPSLDPLFRPRSIAVVGASRKNGTIGAELLRNVLSCGFPGPVYPVNPGARVVQSVRAYPSVRSVPDDVDLALIATPGKHVESVVNDCVAKGVEAIVVISAGFGEMGAEGKARQDAILKTIRDHGMRMVGPNCLGLLNVDPTCPVNATFAPRVPKPGPVAFLSQSGALGVTILDVACDLGIGVKQFISVGNKADISANDLLEYWADDPDVRVILLYLESFGNPRRFMRLARRISRHKPILAVKSGRTEAGARAASSHTGSLSGMDIAVDALLGQAGVMRMNTIERMFDTALLLAYQPVPKSNRVAIVTNAGGPGIMASDACSNHGLELVDFDPETIETLKSFLPAEASVRNPVDMLASAGPVEYEQAVRAVLADDNVDSLLVLFVPPIMIDAPEVADAIRRGAEGTDKTIATTFMGSHGVPEALSSLRAGHFPSYAFPESAARAIARAVWYGEWLEQPPGTIPDFSDIDGQAARKVVQAALEKTRNEELWLDPAEVRALLAAYGLRGPKSALARSAEQAVAHASEIGEPVALKLVSPTITHKSDVGGVKLWLRGADQVRNAFTALEKNLEARGQRGEMEGALIQEMAQEGLETFIGATYDPQFGPLIGFGIGGVHVEVWRDVVFRVHPLTDLDAQQMLDGIRGKKLLDGVRGEPAADRDALRDALLRVSQMISDLPEIVELDMNPLFALEPGRGVLAVDARIRLRPTPNAGRAG